MQSSAKLRRDIAYKTETPNAEDFGTSRETLSSMDYLFTPLKTTQYKELNKKIKTLVLDSFPKIKNKDKGVCVTEGISRYTFRLARDETMNALLSKAASQTDYNRMHEMQFSMMVVDEYKSKTKPLFDLVKDIHLTEQQKFDYLANPDKNIYIYSGRIEILVNKEWRTLTRHYSIIGCDDAGEIEDKNIKDYQLHGFITLLHTNHQDFKLHQPRIEELFNKVLDKKASKEERLIAMREFEYRVQHMVYFKRGGQAIVEMILEAIKRVVLPEYEIKGHFTALAEPYFQNYMK